MSRIHIFCALPAEAAPVAKALGLKPVQDDTFRRFVSADKRISLLVTGTGKVRCCSGVVYERCMYGSRGDVFINLGIAGASAGLPKGGVFLIDKVTDQASRRSFYPDIPHIDHKEAHIICVDSPVEAEAITKIREELDITEDVLVDMESAGFYQAASMFTGPHNIIIIKAVSDNGDLGKVGREDVAGYLESAVEILRQIPERITDDEDDRFDSIFYERLCEDMRCTEYMRGTLRQIYIYAISEGIDIEKIAAGMTEEGILPVRDKKSATSALELLRKRVVES